jgi:predicted transcriptional regulator
MATVAPAAAPLRARRGDGVPRALIRLPGLRAARLRAFLTQEQLAERSGVSVFSISRLEQGERPATIPTVQKLATALGVEPRELTEPPAG